MPATKHDQIKIKYLEQLPNKWVNDFAWSSKVPIKEYLRPVNMAGLDATHAQFRIIK